MILWGFAWTSASGSCSLWRLQFSSVTMKTGRIHATMKKIDLDGWMRVTCKMLNFLMLSAAFWGDRLISLYFCDRLVLYTYKWCQQLKVPTVDSITLSQLSNLWFQHGVPPHSAVIILDLLFKLLFNENSSAPTVQHRLPALTWRVGGNHENYLSGYLMSPLSCYWANPEYNFSNEECRLASGFSILKMETLPSSETSVHTWSTRRHIPEDGIFQSHGRENLKSYIIFQMLK
jgi:hypothetical protein